VQAGGGMSYYAPCGGGYGDPLKRPARKVLDDVLDDFCTRERAFEVYGVVIDADLKLDVAATQTRRAAMRGPASQAQSHKSEKATEPAL
jgi:N-methylhydantoinase B